GEGVGAGKMQELPVERIDAPEPAAAEQYEVADDRIEHRLHIRRQAGKDAQYVCRRPLLLPRLAEFAPVSFELLFEIGTRLTHPADARLSLRSGRTKLAAARWAICAFERQGHLAGIVTGPLPVGPRQGSSLSILTEPHDELAPFHSITSSARVSSVGGTSRPSDWAVLRLMNSSIFVDCWTGRSAGFSPLTIRPA